MTMNHIVREVALVMVSIRELQGAFPRHDVHIIVSLVDLPGDVHVPPLTMLLVLEELAIVHVAIAHDQLPPSVHEVILPLAVVGTSVRKPRSALTVSLALWTVVPHVEDIRGHPTSLSKVDSPR